MRKRSILIGVICLLNITEVLSQNLITPPGVSIANPEARVFRDGRMYIYGSRDESDSYWCSYTYHILSSSDLKHWVMDENIFSSRGNNDAIKDSDKLLFAPDCIEYNGKYYLYYCLPHPNHTEGVVIADHPTGPFRNGIHIEGANQIDPVVLVDDDGKGYFYWGQATLKATSTDLSGTTLQITGK